MNAIEKLAYTPRKCYTFNELLLTRKRTEKKGDLGMLYCNDLVKSYRSLNAVDHVNCCLEPGNIYALLGPNGSGKTTLMKMIAGLIKPTSGEIIINGELLNHRSKAHITYMPTESYFYGYMKIKDVETYYKDFFEDFNADVFHELLYKMELNFPDKVSRMSTGMLAKLKVALAMSRDSDIIMMDEPLNGIDMIAREYVARAIFEYTRGNKTVVVSSHLVDDLEPLVTGALFMKQGKMILAGDANKMRQANQKSLVQLYKEVYGFGGVPYATPY